MNTLPVNDGHIICAPNGRYTAMLFGKYLGKRAYSSQSDAIRALVLGLTEICEHDSRTEHVRIYLHVHGKVQADITCYVMALVKDEGRIAALRR